MAAADGRHPAARRAGFAGPGADCGADVFLRADRDRAADAGRGYAPQGAGWVVQLHEKGGKRHAMPAHHALSEAVHAYVAAAEINKDRKGWLFRSGKGRRSDLLSERPLLQGDAWAMIRRRAATAGIATPVGCHYFRATGITAYLMNGGTLEHAQAMAAHERPRTTRLYDRTQEQLTQDEVERIRF